MHHQQWELNRLSPIANSICSGNRTKFIAGSQTEKLKRKTLVGNYTQGGFKMTDVREQNKAIKVSWLKCFINNPGMRREFVMEQILHVDYRYLLRCNL